MDRLASSYTRETSMENTVLDTKDSINADHLQAMVTTIGNALAQTASSQVDAVRIQSDANVKVAEISHRNERLHTHYAFALRIFGGLAIIGVIGGGFWTGHFELVTHALAGVGGMFAGYGLARASR